MKKSCVRDLRRTLDRYYQLRGPSYIAFQDEQYSLALSIGSNFDALTFQTELKRIKGRLVQRKKLGNRSLDSLRRPLALFSGPYLPEQRFAEFAVDLREQLNRDLLYAIFVYAQSLADAKRIDEAITALERGVVIDPLWGEGVQMLMTLRARAGELCRGLRSFRDYEKRLRDELGVKPDREMRATFQRLVRM
jgi:DNA-binding SARP family transcriptional activator